ncbi:hypothetical protein HF086_013882 [Spodoptera exigua]|uniref:Uncharacterized protein n=1 Tax=Spodoptera exigua TaxID=7107 RepID=A0A922SGL3_SPOEX|nr:hypothetical protein HF086_013882 [Spodoptera exigua]
MVLTKRDAINKRITSTNKILLITATGVLFLLFPIVISIVDPIPMAANYLLRVANGSIVYDLIQHEMPAAELSLYLFNITNADRFLSGEDDKLKVEEVGPFVYHEQTFEEDTYEGALYPPMLTPDMPINWYRLGICKTFNLQYLETRGMHYGGEALIYTISNETFSASVNPINRKPYPNGVQDISDCYFGLPFVISKSHYLDCDPKLYERIEGIKPNREQHSTEIIIDKKLSVMYNTKMSIQLTMMLDDLSFSWQNRMLSHAVVPVVNVVVNQPKLTEWVQSKLVLVYQVAPYIVMTIQAISALLGILLVIHAARLQYLNYISKNRTIVFETVDENILKSELPLIPK